ncbi:MAG: ABC transporter ATP-binding protein [Planctomycetota bacterium]|nr:ABC transporter ATP-binding protein [Planctomycetota bacterium]
MKYFFRSIRYLWPYRARLGMAMACVILIMLFWAGGLGALLPGAKILISDEGLHDWAWRSMAEDRLDAKVVARAVRGEHIFGQQRLNIARYIDVVDLDKKSLSAEAGLKEAEWLVGLAGEDGKVQFLGACDLAKVIGKTETGRTVNLAVYDPQTRTGRIVANIPLTKAGLSSRVLGALSEALPYDQYTLLLMLLGFGIVITILRDIFRFVQEYLVQSAVYRGLMDLRCDNYNVVLHLPTTFFSEKGITDSMSRFIQDTGELARGQITLFGKTLVEPGKLIASLAVALCLSWQLTLLTLVVGPPAFFVVRKFGKIMKRASRRALESWASMLGVLEETLTGIRVVKAYTMEGSERRRFFRVNRALLKQQRRIAAIDSATSPSVEAIGIIAAMGAIAVAGYLVIKHPQVMDQERFFALMACLVAMFDPVRKLAHVNTRFQRADAAAKRVFELQDQRQENIVRDAPTLPRHKTGIEFRNVSFRYPGADEDALKDICLKIPANQTLAIVGPNGCGKTTLVSLLPRLLDPTGGQVLIDGADISAYSIRSLRRQIGLVTQDAVVFHASIGENIAYGKRRPAPGEIESAAQKAFVDEFVAEMPDGYETMVGEHGATLSGGQRQRIAIARAILRNPAILIFDEATSQIDPDSEQKIHQALTDFRKGRTTLLIAHRLSTVLEADRIAMMSAGRIVDVGTHAELLGRCGPYRQLYQSQFAPEKAAEAAKNS